MNKERRALGRTLIALLEARSEIGEIDDTTHEVISESIALLQNTEYWQLQNQQRHEGSNASTDQQLAICRVALPALEEALKAWNADEYERTITNITIAVETDGKPTRRKARRARK